MFREIFVCFANDMDRISSQNIQIWVYSTFCNRKTKHLVHRKCRIWLMNWQWWHVRSFPDGKAKFHPVVLRVMFALLMVAMNRWTIYKKCILLNAFQDELESKLMAYAWKVKTNLVFCPLRCPCILMKSQCFSLTVMLRYNPALKNLQIVLDFIRVTAKAVEELVVAHSFFAFRHRNHCFPWR